MTLVVVGGDHQITVWSGAGLAAGGDLQPVVTPPVDDRQLQRQIGDGDHTGVVIGDLLNRLLLWLLRGGVGRYSGTRVLQQALGFLPGTAILTAVIEEKEQCCKYQHCSQGDQDNA